MNILITGSNGLIGKRLCNKLRDEHNIIEIDRELGNTIEFLNVSEYNHKIDLIIHMASNCIIRDIIAKPKLAFDNIWNNYNIYELARKTGCNKVIYFSSSRVTHDEENPYIAGKRYGENLAHAYYNCYGINSLIIRPETVWAIDDKKKRVMTNWILSAMNNEDITVYGNKEKQLSPIHADDFVHEFVGLLPQFLKGKTKPLTRTISGKALTVVEIIDIILKVTKSKSKVVFLEGEKTQPQQCFNSDIVIDNFEENVRKEIE